MNRGVLLNCWTSPNVGRMDTCMRCSRRPRRGKSRKAQLQSLTNYEATSITKCNKSIWACQFRIVAHLSDYKVLERPFMKSLVSSCGARCFNLCHRIFELVGILFSSLIAKMMYVRVKTFEYLVWLVRCTCATSVRICVLLGVDV